MATQKNIQSTRVSALITEAADLMRIIKDASDRVNAIKLSIRLEGLRVKSRRGTNEAVVFDSPAGTASVVFVDDSPSLVKGADPCALREALGEETWLSLFNVKVTLAPAFEEALEALALPEQDKVKTIVVWSENTPRVILPTRGVVPTKRAS